MKRFVPGALAGLAAATLLAAPALAGPTVTVRVEGEHGTLLDSTRVTLPDSDTLACGSGGAHTVADALELATGGNWDRAPGLFTQTILGETHDNTPDDFWAEWIGSSTGYVPGALGVCDDVLKEGDEALLYATRFVSPATHFPLALEGLPAVVEAGKPTSVTVVAYETQDFMTVTRTPVAGATVSGGGASAVTGADGTAVLVFAQAGDALVRASKAGSVISAGKHVTVAAPGTVPPSAPSSGGRDTTAPVASISGLANGRVFSRKRAPRTLRGTVSADPSGIKSVRLSILRKRGGRCWAFDGESERFERHRCGGSRSFRIGDRAEWSYLLPKRLPRGRYTIRVVAIDNAGNDSATKTEIRVK
jgi:hypothetical protein